MVTKLDRLFNTCIHYHVKLVKSQFPHTPRGPDAMQSALLPQFHHWPYFSYSLQDIEYLQTNSVQLVSWAWQAEGVSR